MDTSDPLITFDEDNFCNLCTDFLENRKFPVVKMDVQGFECRALQGMRSLLRTTHTLRVELADRWLRAQGCSVPEALALLSELNFTAVGHTRCAMSRYGCDVTFVRNG